MLTLQHSLQTKGHHTWADRYFMTVETACAIEELGQGLTGTIRKDRGSPTHWKEKGRGVPAEQGVWRFARGVGNLSVVQWFDSGICYFLSNMMWPSATTVERRKRGVHGRLTVTAPNHAKDFNKYMGGVDYHDQLRAYHSCRLSSFKWYMAVFYFLLDVALINSWAVYQICVPSERRPTGMDWRKYLEFLAKELMSEHRGEHLSEVSPSKQPVAQPVQGVRGQQSGGGYDPVATYLFDVASPAKRKRSQEDLTRVMPNNCHYISDNHPKRYCKLCYDTYDGHEFKVRTRCEKCSYNFHIECFEAWHSQVKPVSPHPGLAGWRPSQPLHS